MPDIFFDNSEFYKSDNSDPHRDIINSALMLYKKGRYQESLERYLDLLNYYSGPTLYLELGNCYFQLGKNKFALEYWKKVIEMDIYNKTAYSNMGNVYYKTGNLSYAIENWLMALTIEPEDAKVNLNVAIAYADRKMRFESIKYYEKYLKYEKSATEDYKVVETKMNCLKDEASENLKQGTQFQAIGNHAAALDCYIKALSFYPNYSKTNYNIGSLFFMDHNYAQAIKYWLKSYYIDPQFPKTMLNLAISFDCMEKFDEAYCFYVRYLDFILEDKDEYNKVSNRIAKIKGYLEKNPFLIDKHLQKAEEAYHTNDFYVALLYYQNYTMLKPASFRIYQPLIEKLSLFINPEAVITRQLNRDAQLASEEGDYLKAIQIYERGVLLSEPGSSEYSHFKAKHTLCLRKIS